METSYLKAHPFGDHYPEWMPNLPLGCDQDTNSSAWRSLAPQITRGSTAPPCVIVTLVLFILYSQIVF